MKRTFLLTIMCSFVINVLAENVITYTATEKLLETTNTWSEGLHTNAFNVAILSHSFSNGTGTITFNGEVTTIGDYAFDDCTGLTSITIPNSVTWIGNWAFSGCIGLTSITIPNSVTTIGYGAFNRVLNIVYHGTATGSPWYAKNVDKYVEGYLIYDDTKKVLCGCSTAAQGEIIIPNSVISIGGGAFEGCSGLTKTNYTGTIADWCKIKFNDYYSNPICYSHNFYINDVEVKDLVIPQGVDTIGDYAFADCTSFTSVTIPNSVITIGDGAFYGCYGLTSITIPNSVTTIGSSAFEGCSGLTSVTIGNSVTTIGSSAFHGCNGLARTNFMGTIADWCKIKFVNPYANPIYYSHNFYINDVEVKDLVIPEGVDTIGDNAFAGCTGLTSVNIPNSVTTIGGSAFANCSGLTSITIPESVVSIDDYGFAGCNALRDVMFLGNNPPKIGEDVFSYTIYHQYTYYYSGLEDLTMHIPCGTAIAYKNANVNRYNAQKHSGWNREQSPTYAYYPMTTFGDFAYDYQIQSSDETYCSVAVLSEPDCETSKMTFAAYPKLYFRFDGWSDGVQSLERTITITQDTTIVALGAYDNTCGENLIWSLDTISGILTISGSGAMNRVPWADWASKIKIINLPEGLTTIATGAFAECSNVKEITIPTTVTSIGDGAFANCTGLRTITCFATNPPLAENYVFYGVSQYTKTYVLASSLEDYQFALGWRDLNLLPIGSTETTITTDTVIIQPSVTEATFTWPVNPSADGYSLEITKDGVVFCTLKFNAQGQLTGIAFAPGRGGEQRTMPAAEMTTSGWQFTVTGLDQASKYGYTLDALNASQQSIKHYEGEFVTDGYTGLDELTIDNAQCTMKKFIRNNQLLILHNGKMYNALGF